MDRFLRIKNSHHLRTIADSGSLNFQKMIQPLFLIEGLQEKEAIKGLPGVYRETELSILTQIEEDIKFGVSQFLLFLVPKEKSETHLSVSFYNRSIQSIKNKFPDIFLWVDTCICSVTTTGHCCHFHSNGKINLEASLAKLSNLALVYAESGADGIAPSDMMDGRVLSHRTILDKNGFETVPIMSYSTKFKSNLYGPFRGAAESSPSFGDRSSYQLDIRDKQSAIGASIRDAKEGADFLMIKPGLTGIDLICPIKEKTGLPIGAYQVSGEYASLYYLSKEGFLDWEEGLVETWNVFRRTEISYLITYAARISKRIYS